MKHPRKSRDSESTKREIVQAAARILAAHGFTGLGVNALAVEAGVDKQLIYYHFGGLDGVVRALGSDLELWLGAPLAARPGETYAAAVARLMTGYLAALRGNALVLRLLAWEAVESSAVLKELESARSAAMQTWVADLRAAASPPPAGIDAPAINAILLAGIHYLALHEQTTGQFAGMDIASAEGQARLDAALKHIASKAYGA